jgi:hypothetical protein
MQRTGSVEPGFRRLRSVFRPRQAICSTISGWTKKEGPTLAMDREQLLNSRRASIFGVEFDWLLVDAEERVAVCCSSLDGDIPDLVLEIEESRHDQFLETLAALARGLPVVGGVRAERGGMGTDEAAPELARRGLFVLTASTEAALFPGLGADRPGAVCQRAAASG